MAHMFTEQLTQSHAIVGYIPPSNHAANTDTSVAGIDMSNIRRLISLLQVGACTAAPNVQLFYYSSANANMNGTTNLGNASGFTTQIVQAGTNNRIDSLEIRADQLPAGHRYVQPVVVTNSNATNLSLLCFGSDCNYKPDSQFTVANIVDAAAGGGTLVQG